MSKKDLVTAGVKVFLDETTEEIVNLVGDLTLQTKIDDEEEGDYDWEIFLNANMIMINGLMHHYLENHLKVLGDVRVDEYFKMLEDNLMRVKLYYSKADTQIN